MTDKPEANHSGQPDFWANWHGFNDADELKRWGEKAERDRLAEQTSNKGADES